MNSSAHLREILEQSVAESRALTSRGKLASYIPELARSNSGWVGAAVVDINGNETCAGDCDVWFTMQSISKIISLMIALEICGEDAVFSKVGKEPTGDPFNSIVRLETYRSRKPLNPLINAGAIAICSLIPGDTVAAREKRILSFLRDVTLNPKTYVNGEVYESEKATGFRNHALAWFLKDLGVIEGSVDDCLDLYFRQCSMEITARDLARIGAFLANDGVVPQTQKRLVQPRTARIAKSLMSTCGLYDGSGEFGVEVGAPAKSGVGGGIVCAVPNRMGIGVFGPALDDRGNSVAGVKILEKLSRELHIAVL